MTKFKLSSINSLFFIFLVAPYYLNDLVYFFIQDHGTLYFLFDYLLRIFSLISIFSIFGLKNIRNLFLKPKGVDTIWLILLVLIGIINDFVLYEPLNHLFKPSSLFTYPGYPNSIWRIFDLSIGLLLVALSEELIFRFYLLEWLKEKSLGLCSSAVISSIIFAGIHWGNGSANCFLAFIWGLIPAVYYLKKRSLGVCVLGHYLVNLILFYKG